MHNRYKSIKPITDLGPDWSRGCDHCQFGLLIAPDPVSMLNLSEGRAVQMGEGMIEFCTCRAGHMYRQYLRKVLGSLSPETRRNLRQLVLAERVPTVHAG